MNAISRSVVTVALVMLLSGALLAGFPASVGAGGFSVATLHGTYVFRVTGTTNLSTTAKVFASIGLARLDGAGNITLHSIESEEGTPATKNFTGTYTVNADGTGSIAATEDLPGTGTIDVAIVIDDAKGSGFQIVSQAIGEVISGGARVR